MEEIWKDIKGFENLYQVSNLGRVRSVDRIVTRKNGRKQLYKSQLIKGCDNGRGYLNVFLRKNNQRYVIYIHRLVAETFIGETEGKDINHKDFNRKNNCLSNLEIITRVENIRYSVKFGKYQKVYKDRYKKTKEKYENIFKKLMNTGDIYLPIYQLEKKYNINHTTFKKYGYDEKRKNILQTGG